GIRDKLVTGVQTCALPIFLFSPEHGIRGALDENVSDSVDEKTGLPVYSLYGPRRAPELKQLKDLDALVFDIQDIGCRFYTYVARSEERRVGKESRSRGSPA